MNVILVYNSELVASSDFILNTNRMFYLENILKICKQSEVAYVSHLSLYKLSKLTLLYHEFNCNFQFLICLIS